MNKQRIIAESGAGQHGVATRKPFQCAVRPATCVGLRWEPKTMRRQWNQNRPLRNAAFGAEVRVVKQARKRLSKMQSMKPYVIGATNAG